MCLRFCSAVLTLFIRKIDFFNGVLYRDYVSFFAMNLHDVMK